MTHDELRKLALAASPGPWSASAAVPASGFMAQVFGRPGGGPQHECGEGDEISLAVLDGPAERGTANAAFIAAANPAAVLALLDENARLRQALEQAFAYVQSAIPVLRAANPSGEEKP